MLKIDDFTLNMKFLVVSLILEVFHKQFYLLILGWVK